MGGNEESIKCPKCNKENSKYSLLCSNCFSPLPSPQFDLDEDKFLSSHQNIIENLKYRIEERLKKRSRDTRDFYNERSLDVNPSGFSEPFEVYRKKNLDKYPELYVLDNIMEQDFDIFHNFKNTNLFYPTVYCETLDEYFDPYMKILNLSESTKKEIINHLKEKALREAELTGGMGEFGVNWPGLGCYINGWLFSYNRSENAAEALKNPDIKPFIFATVAHEKHGHGFITEFTKTGKEKKEIQLYRQEIASKFNIKLADTPVEVSLQEKWNILFQSSLFLEEGWSVWIEKYLLHRFSQTENKGVNWTKMKLGGKYALDDTLDFLGELTKYNDKNISEPASQCLDAMNTIFYSGQVDPQEIHNSILILEANEAVLFKPFVSEFGQYPRYVLGYLLMDKIEKGCGAKCVLYAVAIAGNVEYHLGDISNTDLARVVSSEPRLNINSRLALLSLIELQQKNDIEKLVEIAREELNLKIPENLRF